MTGFGKYRRRSTEPVDDVPAHDVSGLTGWQASRWAEIRGANPHCTVGYGQARTDLVAGLRALADFLEANPAVPIPRYGHMFSVTTSGSDEQKLSQVKFTSLAIGEDAMDDTASGGHYWTQRRFGPVSYRINAVSDAAMRRWHQATTSVKPGADSFARSEDDQPDDSK